MTARWRMRLEVSTIGATAAAVALIANVALYLVLGLREQLLLPPGQSLLHAASVLNEAGVPLFAPWAWLVLNLPATAAHLFCSLMVFGETLRGGWAVLPFAAFAALSSAQWYVLGSLVPRRRQDSPS